MESFNMIDDRSDPTSPSPWRRQRYSILTKIVTLGVGAMTLATSAFAQSALDHLACYAVKDPLRKGTSTVTLTNAGVTQSCTIGSRAQLGCLATEPSDVVPAPPGGGPAPGNVGDFLCYKLSCPKPFPPGAQMTDGFGGTRVVRFKAALFLCAPATRGTEMGSSTTTTTLASGPCDFNSDSRSCEGTCGNGGHCSAVTSGGACECRTTSCGDASTPECNGFCNPGQACTFDITGCRCLNIP
jgi:hypothetical protein